MHFTQHRIAEQSSRFIEAIFHFKDFVPDHSIERVVPTGHIFLIFELDGIVRHTYNNDTLQPEKDFTQAWISGMHRNYISISAHPHSEMFVIQFKATGAYPYLHIPIEVLNEKVMPAEHVLGENVLELRRQLLNTVTAEEKFAVAETWLDNRFDSKKVPPPDLVTVIEQLQEQPAARLNDILKSYPKTQKHLISQFKKYVGLTPKYYQRILRFSDLLVKLQHKQQVAWTDIAYSCGYSDQAHFIKEFQHFSGFNPGTFIQQEYQKLPANFFPLDR